MSSKLRDIAKVYGKGVAIAAPIAATAVGGPAAGAATQAAVNKIQQKAGGAKAATAPVAESTMREMPQSASSLGEARAQDKARMKRSYGI